MSGDNIVSFAAAREERSPHFAGEAKCVGCGHEWAAVAPAGTQRLDCPSCDLPKGVWKHPFGAADGDRLFICNCGSEALTAYFRKGRFRIVCMGCGTDQTSAIFGEAE